MTPIDMGGNNENDRVASPESVPIHLNFLFSLFTEAAFVHDTNVTQIRISDKTICMIARQGNNNEYQHYNVHSLYGWSQTLPTLE